MPDIGADLQSAYEEGFHDGYDQAMSEMPEIIRCKDCKWAVNIGYGWFHCRMLNGRHIDNWYCADGIPKKET